MKGIQNTNHIRKQNLFALLICIAGIAFNLLLGTVVSKFNLPIYLDTVGTVAVAAMGGYLPGVIVGFTTYIIKSINYPEALNYGVVSSLVAVIAAYFGRHGWFKKIHRIVLSILILSLICTGIGTLIPWLQADATYESGSLTDLLINTGFFHPIVAYFLATLAYDLVDKTITVIFAIIILRLVPQKFYDHVSFKGWVQKPISDEDLFRDRSRIRVMSLRTKILLGLGTSLTIVAAVAMGIGAIVYTRTNTSNHRKTAITTAQIASRVLDGNSFDDYIEKEGKTIDYVRKKVLLQQILESTPDISYLYVIGMDDEGLFYIFDTDGDEDHPAETIGNRVHFDEEFDYLVQDLMAGKVVEPAITDDEEYGRLLTSYCPIYDNDRHCVGYAAADVDLDHVVTMERSLYVQMISVFLGFFILLSVFIIWLVRYQIIYPINAITECVDKFGRTKDTQEEYDKDVVNIRGLEVYTGDEIEKLYNSLCRMTLSQAEQMRSIRRLSESTEKMQDGMIITMANMVENRDSDTGAHIQKTSAYVKIIVDGLMKKGYYAEKINPKFISDVVRSAPLHDVGKINIPDSVLNKPDKLTEEEFAIMKTHTTMGKLIIEDAISTVEGENYLKEARNMAAYHHERWDGKGYPEGLHGEVIPLSARIMAVADVFDALTSPRIYKPAYPIEEALIAIKEGAGTQFDPKIVEAFLDSVPEIRVIMRKYNRVI